MRPPLPLAAALAALCIVHVPAGAQEPVAPEVRQIVTFHLSPGTLEQTLGLYERQLLPVYEETAPLLRFRAYRESESPEPLDLVVVSTFAGMAGMDRANEEWRRARRAGPPVFVTYGQIARLTQSHHDQFVEMLRGASDEPVESDEGRGLTVFEYTRVVPGGHAPFEQVLLSQVRGWEKERVLYQWSEAGRLIVSDGWDYLRIFGVENLGAWHHYSREFRYGPFQAELAPLVAARKVIVLRHEPRLDVR